MNRSQAENKVIHLNELDNENSKIYDRVSERKVQAGIGFFVTLGLGLAVITDQREIIDLFGELSIILPIAPIGFAIWFFNLNRELDQRFRNHDKVRTELTDCGYELVFKNGKYCIKD